FDADEHHGETDGRACLESLKRDYFPNMYICWSEGGWSGYVWLLVPTCVDDKGEEKPACIMAEMNRLRVELNDVCLPLARARGFKCGLEVHGSFLKRTQERD